MRVAAGQSQGVSAKAVEANGVRLSYAVSGGGSPVVCIQGVGVAGSGWAPQVEALRDRHTVVTFDNRGIGQSTLGKAPVTIDAMARDAVAILDAEGFDRAHLIGHSMGGLIALQVAATRPDRVASLSLLCTFADGAAPTRPSPRMVWLGLRTRVGTRAMRRNAMLEMVMSADYLRQSDRVALGRRLGTLFGHDLADHPPIAMTQLRAMSKVNLVSELPAIDGVPTLVVSGAHDPIAPPRCGRAIAAGIRGARYEEFADASHALPIQCAARLNTLLAEHLATADAAATR